jgi:hypothetical protein
MANRTLVPKAASIVRKAFAESVRLQNLQGALDSIESMEAAAVDPYRVYVRHKPAGDEVVIAPRRFCFCRPTFVICGPPLKIRLE